MSDKLSKLNDLIATGNYAKAELYLYDYLKNNPNDYSINKNLGMTLLAQKKYEGALKSFEKCYFINNKDVDILLNLSYLFLRVQDHEQSIKFANEAIKLNSDLAGAYQNLSVCYLEMKDFDQAEKYANLVINLRGGITSEEFLKYSDFIDSYTDILIATKQFDKFIKFAQDILDKKIFDGDLFKKLLNHDRSKIKQKYIDQLQYVVDTPGIFKNIIEKNSKSASALICLAEYNKKQKDLSEKYYVEANMHIASMQRAPIYARQKMYLNLTEYFTKFNEEQVTDFISKEKGDGLIFIIGMPRSGTTLIESILSTADDIVAGGEKVFFTNNLWSIFADLKPGVDIDPKYIDDLGNRYLDTIAMQRGGARFFIDKMPGNFLYYKFIKLAFPKAKFIHTYRDPWDNAISLFKANFQESIVYASSFFAISNEYSNYSFLMNFWKKTSNNNLFDISYEEVVTNTNDIVGNLWSFCNLQGDYSDVRRKNHYANTASRQQVSQNIYISSLKKEEFIEYRDQFHEDLANQDLFWKKRDFNF